MAWANDRLCSDFPWTSLDVRQFLQHLCEVETISALWTTFFRFWVIHQLKKSHQGPRHWKSSLFCLPSASLLATALSCQGIRYRTAVGTTSHRTQGQTWRHKVNLALGILNSKCLWRCLVHQVLVLWGLLFKRLSGLPDVWVELFKSCRYGHSRLQTWRWIWLQSEPYL